VNSLLSRARQTVRSKPWAPPADPASPAVRQLLGRYLRAWQLADIAGFVQIVADDVRLSMPPMLTWFDGREAVAAFVEAEIFAGPGRTACRCGPAGATDSPPSPPTIRRAGPAGRQRPAGPRDRRARRPAAGHRDRLVPQPGPGGPLRPARLARLTGAADQPGAAPRQAG